MGAAGLFEAVVEVLPVAGLVAVEGGEWEEDERVEQVVKLVLVAEVGPDFAADGCDGCGVDAPGFVGEFATESGGAGAALFEASFIEVGVGVGVEELMREDGGRGGVDCEAADGASSDSPQELDEAFEVHGFLEDVLHDFIDEGVIGNLDVANDGLEAGRGLGEDGGHEVFGAGALDLRGDTLALGHAQELEAAGSRPAPAIFEDR